MRSADSRATADQIGWVEFGPVLVHRSGAGRGARGHGLGGYRVHGHGEQRGRRVKHGVFQQAARPPVPDQLIGPVGAAECGGAVRRHRQSGDGAQMSQHLGAVVGARRDHRTGRRSRRLSPASARAQACGA